MIFDALPRALKRSRRTHVGVVKSQFRACLALCSVDKLAEPELTKAGMLAEARAVGLTPPEAYAEGFAHANCAGMCVRAGQRHWLRLLQIHPDRFRDVEEQEQRFRARYGDVAILKQIRGGRSVPLPLAELRRRHETELAAA